MKQLPLPSFALPFVTRAFRGPRLKRFVSLSALLALLTIFLGTYVAIGGGRFEQEVRVSLGHEKHMWEQQREEFKISTRYDWEAREMKDWASRARAMRETDRAGFLAAAAAGYDGETALGWNQVNSEIYDAYHTVEAAVLSPPSHRGQRALQERAAAAINMSVPASWEYTDGGFGWYSDDEVQRLEMILERDLIPAIEPYRSPLGFTGAVRFVGGLAATLLSLLMLVLAPLVVAVRQTSEVHENTLQPLTGTSLSPGELARGLRAGPLAVIAVFALPLALITLTSSLFVGTFGRALVLMTVIGAGAYGMSAFGQLIGQVAGARRTPGIVGVALLLGLGIVWFIGAALGFDAPRDAAGMLGAVPQSSAAFLQVWALGLGKHHDVTAAAFATIAFGAFAWMAFGVIATRVTAHRVGALEGPALPRSWAFGGAAVATVLACLSTTIVLRGHVSHEERQLFYFIDLLFLALPFAMLLMARVPLAEAPPSLRKLPVPQLLGELFGFVALHMAIAACFVGGAAFEVLSSPIAVFYLLWSVAVVGLVAIRAAALPVNKVLTHLWFAFCALAVLVAGVHVVGWTVKHGLNDAEDVLALGQLSPLLGLLQAVCLVAIPWLCIRGLRQRFASLR